MNELGTYYQTKKQYKEAIEAYTRSISISQTKPYRNNPFIPYANIASALLLDNRPAEARNFIRTKALKDFPDNPDVYILLAFAESEAGNHRGALEAVSHAQRLLPNDQNVAKLYLQLKKNIPLKWNPH